MLGEARAASLPVRPAGSEGAPVYCHVQRAPQVVPQRGGGGGSLGECMYIATSSEPESRASPKSHMCIYRGTRLAPASPAGGQGSPMPHLRTAHSQTVELGCRQQRPFWGLRHGLRQVASHGRRARARARVSAAHPQKLSCSGVPRSQTPSTCASREGLGSPVPHLQRDRAFPCRSCDLVTLRSDRRRCAQSRLDGRELARSDGSAQVLEHRRELFSAGAQADDNGDHKHLLADHDAREQQRAEHLRHTCPVVRRSFPPSSSQHVASATCPAQH